jgi:hypothetical protein
MLDIYDLPNNNPTIDIFYTQGSIFQTWKKPRGCKFVYMILIGGGGGGGGGQSGINTNRSGGGGGGASACIRSFFMANTLPDTLFVRVGSGGSGGLPNGNGGSGVVSIVSITTSVATNSQLLSSSRYDDAAGIGGLANGTRGGQGSPITGFNFFYYLGIPQFFSGTYSFGGTGGLNTGGSGVSVTPTMMLCGGAGGGGSSSGNTDGNGGSILFSGLYSNMNGGLSGGTNNGASGFIPIEPSKISSLQNGLFFFGGAGGGANGIGVGGNGGNGGYGCGGGGGGAGVTGGRGGKGGDGLIIIVSW